MTGREAEGKAFALFLYTLAVFVLMQVFAIATGGAGAQEPHEIFTAPQLYTENLLAAGANLRIVLLFDLFFIIGYASALGLTAYANAPANPLMGWAAGLGVVVLTGLDIGENLIMVISLDMAQAGFQISAERIGLQAGISGAKWLVSALAIVALTFTLPQNTLPERLLVWGARLALPAGTGLFVTGAFAARLPGGLLILLGMAGGFVLLALTIGQRRRRA